MIGVLIVKRFSGKHSIWHIPIKAVEAILKSPDSKGYHDTGFDYCKFIVKETIGKNQNTYIIANEFSEAREA